MKVIIHRLLGNSNGKELLPLVAWMIHKKANFSYSLTKLLQMTSNNKDLETAGFNVFLVQLQNNPIESKRFLPSLWWFLKVFMVSKCIKMELLLILLSMISFLLINKAISICQEQMEMNAGLFLSKKLTQNFMEVMKEYLEGCLKTH